MFPYALSVSDTNRNKEEKKWRAYQGSNAAKWAHEVETNSDQEGARVQGSRVAWSARVYRSPESSEQIQLYLIYC